MLFIVYYIYYETIVQLPLIY